MLDPDERPHPRDVVLYEALPNELPRVAGILTTVPQTPLSHVNLRAVQDHIPNAFIRGARDDPLLASFITPLVDRYVRYTVPADGWDLRAATQAEVEAHYAAARPTETQTPQRDLSVTEITPLSQVGFADWDAFGVKAANVAELRTLGFPAGTVPDGFAIPFYFYDKFMEETALGEEMWFGYKGAGRGIGLAAETTLEEAVAAILAHAEFQTDFDLQDEMLDDLRDAIEDAATPQWIITAIEAMNTAFDTAFGTGLNRRYRSSTNNEDLPGFNGAGLYDSKSQKPSEDEDDLAKSLKEVYASLWNFRAFTEREFHRADHLAAAMGILVHPSYQDELANGVAASFNPFSGSLGDSRPNNYYVNTQVGEDLVTNPEAHSIPEELLVYLDGTYAVLALSNQVEPGELLMSDVQIGQLRRHLSTIHNHFKTLYDPAADERFAMEIEFKITSENILAIKQARPWVFGTTTQLTPRRRPRHIPLLQPPSSPPPVRPPGPDCTAVPDLPPHILWEGTMTVGTASPADRGFRAGRYGALCRRFTAAGTPYTITGLYHDRAVPYVLRSVFLTATRPLPEELLLWVDDGDNLLQFPSSDATRQGNSLEWSRLAPTLPGLTARSSPCVSPGRSGSPVRCRGLSWPSRSGR